MLSSLKNKIIMKKLLPILFLFVSILSLEAQELTSSVQTSNQTCSLGSITITAEGGDGNYIYAVVASGVIPNEVDFTTDNSITNLYLGDYDVYVRDNNGEINYKEDVQIVTISPVNELTLLLTTDLNCFPGFGSVSVDILGGTAPYVVEFFDAETGININSFSITENTITLDGLEAGNYTVTVIDIIGCVYMETFVINETEELDATSVTTVNPSCNGESNGSIEVIAIGGTGEYQYSINTLDSPFQTSNVFTNLSAGLYMLSIQDTNGCIISLDVEILEPEEVVISSIAIPTGNIASGNIIVEATGGIGDYTYSINDSDFTISNQFFDLEAGTYEIKVSDSNGCISSPLAVTIVEVDIDNTVAPRSSGGLSANYKDAISYQWINVDTNERISGATGVDFIPSKYGNYQVEITIASARTVSGKGIQTVSNSQVVLSPVIEYTSGVLSVNDVVSNSFNVYPNPTTNFINVPTRLLNTNYNIYNLLGSKVNSGVFNSDELSLINLEKGVYILKVDGYKAITIIKK